MHSWSVRTPEVVSVYQRQGFFFDLVGEHLLQDYVRFTLHTPLLMAACTSKL
jgi:hypothetical protein